MILFQQFAQWSEGNGLEVVAAKYNRIPQDSASRNVENGTYIVTSILVKEIFVDYLQRNSMLFIPNTGRTILDDEESRVRSDAGGQ